MNFSIFQTPQSTVTKQDDDDGVYSLPSYNQPASQPVSGVEDEQKVLSADVSEGLDFAALSALTGWDMGQGSESFTQTSEVVFEESPEVPSEDKTQTDAFPQAPFISSTIRVAEDSGSFSSPADSDVPSEQTSVVEVPSEEQTKHAPVKDSQPSVQEIDVDLIYPNPFQPRKFFEPKALQELSDSIREHGVIQPVVVIQTPSGFELVVGERRYRASVMAGLRKVPAIVRQEMADLAKLEVALIENIQRHELNPIEEARGYERLIKSFGLTQEEIAKKLGKARPTVTNTLRLLNLPAEVQRAIMEGRLAEGHARPLLSISDRVQQLALFKEILEHGLNTRQIELKARELVKGRSVDGVVPDPHTMALEIKLRGGLGAQVRIQRQGRGGRITIDFFSEEELEEIIARVAEKNMTKQQPTAEYLTV